MARTEQSEQGIAGPGLRPPLQNPRRRVSTGHVVMIVAGLLATVLTYAVLRQAGGKGTEVVVAASPIRAGQTVDPSRFATTDVRASDSALTGILRRKDLPGITGRVATVDIAKGQLVAGQQFTLATPPPPQMAIAVDPQTIPGGPSALVRGTKIDLVAVSQAGQPVYVPGLVVLKTPEVAADHSLGAATTVRIDVAVPDPATAGLILAATSGGKFVIRVTGTSGVG